mgnify:CR=1 FL=1
MKKVYVTLTGTKYHYGKDFLEPGMKVKLIKEPDNEYDTEAIRVEMKGVGHLGYIANSYYTVLGESMSAGRLYDKIADTAKAKVIHVLPQGVLLKVSKKSLMDSASEEPIIEVTDYESNEVEQDLS